MKGFCQPIYLDSFTHATPPVGRLVGGTLTKQDDAFNAFDKPAQGMLMQRVENATVT